MNFITLVKNKLQDIVPERSGAGRIEKEGISFIGCMIPLFS